MSLNVLGWVVVPMFVFLVGSAGSGIVALVKFVGYMARSQTAQESTAETNKDMRDKLNTYIDRADARFGRIELDVAVLKDRLPPLNGRH
jgi:hypothetical protein